MAQYQITGGIPLKGEILIAGRKNSALKLIAASILSSKPVTLKRVPQIGDVRTMFEILKAMGAIITHLSSDSFQIDTSNILKPEIPLILGRRLRASVVLVGPLLARFGKVTFPHPGGCVIGKRSIAPHLKAFEGLGVKIDFDGNIYQLTTDKLTGAEIYLKEKSVTGTENILMAAVCAEGQTNIYNAAEEPHIKNLAEMLRKLGYKITGDGSSTITVIGKAEISDLSCEIEIIADDIEVGTFAIAAAITKGDITLKRVGTRLELFPILSLMDDFGLNYKFEEETQDLRVFGEHHLTGCNFKTGTWPGFPSDLQSPFTVLATQAIGTSLIHDWMYEGRLYFVSSLQGMGANITICDPHRALVTGPTKLHRSSFISPDLRAGAALVLAALIAEGTSIIEHAELIDRGYEDLSGRLGGLGANIIYEA